MRLAFRHLWLATFFSLFLMYSTLVTAVDEPSGYRLDMYDDQVPETLSGATRVTAKDVAILQSEKNALIVDVIPAHVKPEQLPEGQLWFPVAHTGVAGALWLPDVGYGALSKTTTDYFKYHLEKNTAGNTDHPLVFYCRINCWMSWNAAKRALSFGYTQVYWFADGIEDWLYEGYETEELKAAPGQRHPD
jgi:PQQ-dependent catabolism-associated CXXCW motif protein